MSPEEISFCLSGSVKMATCDPPMYPKQENGVVFEVALDNSLSRDIRKLNIFGSYNN